MDLIHKISTAVREGIQSLYDADIALNSVALTPTRKDFEGDFTLVVFPYAKIAKKAPPQIGAELGAYLKENVAEISDFNVIQGFLNLALTSEFWIDFLNKNAENKTFGKGQPSGLKVMVEFASPNTNKPLHLGHIRNILLGWSCARILEFAGDEVVKVQVINDRGIAICKSMLAWQKFGQGETPQSSGIKGDHLVGKYYVEFEKAYRKEIAQLMEQGQSEAEAKEAAPIMVQARQMLRNWENGDPETRALWQKMNAWVYDGFDATYQLLQVEFDKLYYESDTYLLGKDLIKKGLKDGIFYKKEDGSVWVDLTEAGLDHKLVLRSDGTSVYITQDVGTAHLRYKDFGVDSMIYVVADEQNYHFEVLFEILKRLKEPYADGLYHLNYGMVDLTTGKMKSREGTVVDADELMADIVQEAKATASERGELTELPAEQQQAIIEKIGLAALKFFIIKVSPRKRMTFDPRESLDLQGQTGPYVQNAFVRIKSVLRRAGQLDRGGNAGMIAYKDFNTAEKELLNQLYNFPNIIREAAENYDPSGLANYCYTLAKEYHRFYHEHSILKAESEAASAFRLQLSTMVAMVLENGMNLLGIEMPERM